MFRACKSLASLGATDWGTGYVTTFACMLVGCKRLASVVLGDLF